jgi:hypothetical protein
MGLVSPDMIGHLDTWLQTLQFAVNHYWPDYVVALERTAWVSLINEPWFGEAYTLETAIENNSDPVAPARIFRRRSSFPPAQFVLDAPHDLQFDSAITLQRMKAVNNRARRGESLNVQLHWTVQVDIDTDYRVGFDLVNAMDGQRGMLARDLRPMRGGNPTTQWRAGDRIVDGYSLSVPQETPLGLYWLELIITGEDGPAALADQTGNPSDPAAIGPIQIGADLAVDSEPAYPANVAFADSFSLKGYDLYCTGAGNALSVALHWEATSAVSKDYTVFVHLLSPDGQLVAQRDSSPLLPTGQWTAGTRVLDLHTLALPSQQSLSNHQVRLGLYHWPDMERVPIIPSACLDLENDALLLGTLYNDGSGSSGDLVCPGVRWREAFNTCTPVQSH